MTTVATLKSRALIRLQGEDWRAFLHNLLTNDIDALPTGEARFAALLGPQGRVLFDLFVVAEDDGALIDVAAARRDDLIQKLTLYRLRSRVRIAPDAGAVLAAWGEAPGPGWIADPRLEGLGWRGYGLGVPASADEADYHHHRLSLGVPDPDGDCPPDTTYPIEANFDLLHGVDFQKGCFVGQETTSRMKRRGTIKTRMLPIRFDGPAPAFDAPVLADGAGAGEARTGEMGRAMAVLRLDRIAEAALTVEGRTAQVEFPAWWPA